MNEYVKENNIYLNWTISACFNSLPLIRTRQSVLASTRFKEFPLGPRRRPTKLYCYNKKIWSYMFRPNSMYLYINACSYIWIVVDWNIDS